MIEKSVQAMLEAVPQVGTALVIFLVFWLLSRISNRAIIKVCNRADIDVQITSLLTQSTRIVLITLGAVTALGTLGVNVSALVAGLGLTGFALGFALKDTISNMLAGVLLLVYRPFKIRDRIEVSGCRGTVASIDLRYTTIEDEGTRVLMPNSKLFTSPITILDKES